MNDELRSQVEARLAEERELGAQRLADMERRDKELILEASRASDAYHKLAGNDHDKELTPKAAIALKTMRVLMARMESMGLALAQERSRFGRLNDPGMVEIRLAQALRRGRVPGMKKPRTGGTRERRSRERSEKVAGNREAAVKAAQDALKKFNGDAEKAAAHLNEQKVPSIKGVIGRWEASRVTWTAKKEATKESKAAPKAAAAKDAPKPAAAKAEPAPRKPRAKKEAAKTNGSESTAATPSRARKLKDGGEVQPLTKEAQAKGTSRGGTGTRKASEGNGASKPKPVRRKKS